MKTMLIALTLFLTPAFAQEPARGVIRGRVVRADNGEAIGDADVTLHAANGGGKNAEVARTTSGNDGRFTFVGVAAGKYRLDVRQDGFYWEQEGVASDAASLPITVNAGEEPATISVSLIRAAVIAGRVVDFAGQLLPRANIQALTVTYQNGAPALKPAATRTSNDLGQFRLFWLRPGEYVVQATPPAAPLANKVSSLKAFYPNVTDLAVAARITVKPGDEVAGIDIALPSSETKLSSKPVRISGQVLSTLPGTGTAVPAAAALLLVPHSAADETPVKEVGMADSNTGRFDLAPLPPGSYDLYARVADPQGSMGRGGAVQAWGRALLEVRDHDLENVRLVVHPSINVNGVFKVVGDASKFTTDLKVGLEPAGSAAKFPSYQGVIDRPQTPKADGSFTISAVAEGTYKIQTRGLPANAYIADIRQGNASVLESGIDIADKTPPVVEVVAATDGATLKGTAVSSAIVVIVPAPQFRRQTALYKSATADADGHFVISGIRPGEYTVFSSKNLPEGAYQNAEFLIRNESSGKAVKLTPSSTASVAVGLIAN
jgi:hypothetical protein